MNAVVKTVPHIRKEYDSVWRGYLWFCRAEGTRDGNGYTPRQAYWIWQSRNPHIGWREWKLKELP